jgi:hypothetical protein
LTHYIFDIIGGQKRTHFLTHDFCSVQWLSRVKSENEVTRSKMADLQEAMRRKKERRKMRGSRGSDQFSSPPCENQQVHQMHPTVQHNIAIQQLQQVEQQPMQTDDDNQLGSMSDCVTV